MNNMCGFLLLLLAHGIVNITKVVHAIQSPHSLSILALCPYYSQDSYSASLDRNEITNYKLLLLARLKNPLLEIEVYPFATIARRALHLGFS